MNGMILSCDQARLPAAGPLARLIPVAAAVALLSQCGTTPSSVSFATDDGGEIHADLYGHGDQAVVLAHGGQFDRQSWAPQAAALAEAGFRVLALDFRGYGQSTGPGQTDPLAAPLYLDVLAAVRYLRAAGARTVSVVGASMGGAAAGDAALNSQAGEIDRLVFLGSPATWRDGPLESTPGRKLFLIAADDRDGSGRVRLDAIRGHYDRVPDPKRLLVLDGSAHAQALFGTDQGPRVLAEILGFLSEP